MSRPSSLLIITANRGTGRLTWCYKGYWALHTGKCSHRYHLSCCSITGHTGSCPGTVPVVNTLASNCQCAPLSSNNSDDTGVSTFQYAVPSSPCSTTSASQYPCLL